MKAIAAVGYYSDCEDIADIDLREKRSLLDFDIIFFCPDLSYLPASSEYRGKRCFIEGEAERVNSIILHWRSELTAALQNGKTVIVCMVEFDDFSVDTGERRYSGTGRNRQTTRIVSDSNNYRLVPQKFNSFRPAHGKMIRRAKELSPLEYYWSQLSKYSDYKVYFDITGGRPLLFTKSGSHAVAAHFRSEDGGNLVFVPDLNPPPDSWDEDGEELTPAGRKFIAKFIQAIVAVDNECKSFDQKSETPEWVDVSNYALPEEDRLRKNITEISARMQNLHTDLESARMELESYTSVKSLLYEKGRPLERSIITGLRELGFHVEPYADAESEFDSVITYGTHRFIGEAEGRDSKAIDVSKISQLERNINEDFEREGVTEHAGGILFGNSQRLRPLEERALDFTDKVRSAAKRTGIRLVRTSDLYKVIQRLRELNDPTYAERCRKALIEQAGMIVKFPQK